MHANSPAPAADPGNPMGALHIGAAVQWRAGSDCPYVDGVVMDRCPNDPHAWLVRDDVTGQTYDVPYWRIRLAYAPGATRREVDHWIATFGIRGVAPDNRARPFSLVEAVDVHHRPPVR